MKLYLVQMAPPSMRWQASKSEASKLARTYAAGSMDFEAINVAENGREELADFLNSRELYAAPQNAAVAEAAGAPPTPVAPINASVATSMTADAIVAFILDDAAVHQVENILAAIGTRFGELAKAARRG